MPKMIQKNIRMLVSRFEIKRKNKIVLRENISNSMQAFTLELLLENMDIYMPNPISVSFYQNFGQKQLKR